jgi:ubiquinone/menaquinone biosynthesis C-methylase UbiE
LPADHGFAKDMAGADWAEVYRRQEQRAAAGRTWVDRLALRPGERVLDMGCGPGFFSLLLAETVGPTGLVYAVDRSADALAYLAHRQAERGIAHIRRLTGDGATVPPPEQRVDAALVAMMLHHADHGPGVLANVARWVRPLGRVLVAEFHPAGPREHGPPLAERLPPATVRAWCAAAGLEVTAEERPSADTYLLLCRRPPDAP